MEDEPILGHLADNVTAKILDADKAVTGFHGGQIHAVDGYQPPRHDDPVQLRHEVAEMLCELRAVAAVAHIPVTVGVGVQAGERRGKDGVVDAVIGDAAQGFHAIPLIHCPALCAVDQLVKHIHV